MKNIQNQNGSGRKIDLRAQKWSAVLERFHRSGLTRPAFAKREGLALATLSYWLTREKRGTIKSNPRKPASGGMILGEVKLGVPTLSAEPEWAMEVVSPSGLRVRSRKELGHRVLLQLLRGR